MHGERAARTVDVMRTHLNAERVGVGGGADVIVVGSGVAGLLTAATLGHYGITTTLIDKRVHPSTLPRATVISTRAMEILRTLGLHDEVLAGGVEADVVLWECDTLADAAHGRAHPVGYPTRDQASVVSPCAPATVPQDWLEAVLRRHLHASPSVRCEYGTECAGIRLDEHGVRTICRDRTGAQSERVAAYLVAADGAHSAIRRQLGVEMLDHGGEMGGVQVVFHAPLTSVVGDHRYALYSVTTPRGPGLFLPAGIHDRWVYAPGGDASRCTDPDQLARAIRTVAGDDDLVLDIERVGSFESAAQLSERFRVGRAFLVGDAAHRVTPRGGTGMNTALQDGFDLGWKLAWVLQGWATTDLLDTYESERRLVAEHHVARSADPDGSRRPVVDELNVDLAGRVAHAWLPGRGRTVSTLDVLSPGWTLFTGPGTSSDIDVPEVAAPLTSRSLDGLTARTVGLMGNGALLVRPDGLPARSIVETASPMRGQRAGGTVAAMTTYARAERSGITHAERAG